MSAPDLAALILTDLAILLFLVAGVPGYRGHPRVLALTTACLLASLALVHLAAFAVIPRLGTWAPAIQGGLWTLYGVAFVAVAFGGRPPCPPGGGADDTGP